MGGWTLPKPRVLMLIVNYLPAFSGHAIYLHSLIPLMQRKGYHIEVLAGDLGTYPHLERIGGICVHRIPFDPAKGRHDIWFTVEILKFLICYRNSFDILHINGHIDQYGLLTILCKFLHKRIVMQMVLMGSDDPESLRSQYRFMSVRFRILRSMDKFIHISQPIGESCRRTSFPARKLCYIPQGVNTQRFRPVPAAEKLQMRSHLGLPLDKKVVTFVGAIIHRKGVDILVDAWKIVQKRCPDAELILVGPCDFGAEDANKSSLNAFVDGLRQQISQCALSVRMVGASRGVESFLQASDVFVLPSRKEGFGNVIIEAMACGVPPVVTYMDGVALETVTPGKTGLIVNSCEELADALIGLLSDDDRRNTLGENARNDVLGRFELNHIADKYMAVYDELWC